MFRRRRTKRPDSGENGNKSLELARKGWWHSFDFPSGEHVTGVRNIEELRWVLARFPIPDDLTGKRVLDVGAWDGWFSFEMERRNAEVTAVDCWTNLRFHDAHKQLNSQVRYCVKDVYEMTPDEMGHFDIVLFLGVLYHLKHPLLALEKICALPRDMVCLDSHVIDGRAHESRSIMEFYETDELAGQFDNWTAPNVQCLSAFCRTAGFARVSLEAVVDQRAYVTCYRRWDPRTTDPSIPTPVVVKAIHNLNQGITFSSRRDEYVSCWFRTTERNISREQVQPAVGEWGTVPLSLERKEGDLWQVNFKLPPGLDHGFHEVRIRTGQSAFSNAVRIAVDMPSVAESLRITGVRDGRTWEPDVVRLKPDGVISIWVSGLPENADCNNVELAIGNIRLAIQHVSPPDPATGVQINVDVPADFPPGDWTVQIGVGQTTSSPVNVKLLRD